MVQLASKIGWGIIGSMKASSNLTTTSSVPPFSHNVFIKQNITIGWILEMTIISIENKGASHIVLPALNKLVGALDRWE